MKKNKWIAFLTAGVLTAGAAAVKPMLAETTANAAEGEALKIMCVGDSITDGYIDGNNGYRKYLCYGLQQEGIAYDMVGAQNSWTNEATYNWNGITITYDPAHCGHSGYAIQQYNGRSGIYEVLFGNGNQIDTYDPDMILLQIGTNDLLDARLNPVSNTGDITSTTSAIERLETLVDKILESSDASDTLFLASVPYIDTEVRADWLGSYGWIGGIDTTNPEALYEAVYGAVDTYNSQVKALAEEKAAAGYNVEFCDINSVVDVKNGLYDGVHPNETGYAAMGQLWSDTLSAYINSEKPVVTTTTTTETTTETTTTTTETTTTTTETTTEPTTTTTTETTTITETTTEPTTTTITETTTTDTTTSWIPTTESTTETNVSTETTTTEIETTTQEPITTTVETTTITETTTVLTEEPPVLLKGDVNSDGSVTMVDIVTLKKYIVNTISLSDINAEAADMDDNGTINIFDAIRLLQFIIEQ